MPFFALAPDPAASLWPFAVLVLCVALIIVLITVLRVHAFLALILAAIAAGLLAPVGGLPGEALGKSHWLQAVELTTAEFGVTAGKIAVVIGLASVISMCLMESGAADKVVRRFLAMFGEKRAGAAILVSGYILSIPIFFDTFFMLLLPLARAMRVRTGKDYLLYILAICCGGTVTHSLCAPHPGPLAMAEVLKVDLGLTIVAGIAVGAIPVAASWFAARWLNRRLVVPLRETGGASLEDLRNIVNQPEKELPSFFWSILPVILPIVLISLASTFIAIQGKGFDASDFKQPQALARKLKQGNDPVSACLRAQFSASVQQSLAQYDESQTPAKEFQNALAGELNRVLRSGQSMYDSARFAGVSFRATTRKLLAARPQDENVTRLNKSLLEDAYAGELGKTSGLPPALFIGGAFAGNRNVALLIGAALAIGVLMRQKRLDLGQVAKMIGPPLETAGVIILITSAGGAFGLMLKNAGVGEAVRAAVAGHNINLIFLAWAVAAVIRVAQGSATVAMLTTAAMIYPLVGGGEALPYHPLYLFMAIGFGAMFLSWMNDSGFWVVGRLSGFTEKETLKSWTVVVTVNSVAGLLATWVLAFLLPFAAKP